MKKLFSILIVLALFLNSILCAYDIDNGQAVIRGASWYMLPTVQDTRMQSLGLNNHQIISDYNIWYNPAYVSKYKGIYSEIWNNTTQWGGAITDDVFNGSLGVFVGRPYNGDAINFANQNAVHTGTLFIGTSVEALPNSTTVGPAGMICVLGSPTIYDLTPLALGPQIDVLYGKNLTDKIRLGAGLSYSTASDNKTVTFNDGNIANIAGEGTASNEQAISDMQIKAGVILKNIKALDSLDVTCSIAMPKMENSYTTTVNQAPIIVGSADSAIKSDNGINLSLEARAIKKNEKCTKILGFGIKTADVSSIWTEKIDLNNAVAGFLENDEMTCDDKANTMQIDYTIHKKINKKMKVIYSGAYASYSRKIKILESDLGLGAGVVAAGKKSEANTSLKGFGIPVSVGMEYEISKKLVTRCSGWAELISNYSLEITERDYMDANADGINDTANQEDTRELTVKPYSAAPTFALGLGFMPTKDLVLDFGINVVCFDLFINNVFVTRTSVKYRF